MTALVVHVQGIGFWSDRMPDWAHASAVFRGTMLPLDTPTPRPAPPSLSPAERRRAPDTVVMALHVAAQATQAAGVHAGTLASVFASAHGDLGTTDYLCETLAHDPTGVSPTRFIHSVHNAASGAWGIANGCTQPSVAVAAHANSFAMGLFEASMQCVASQAPVLLVAYDVQTVGPIAQLAVSDGCMALALVLAPHASAATTHRCILDSAPWHGQARALPVTGLTNNARADALPCLDALACAEACAPLVLALPLHPNAAWTLTVTRAR